LADLTFIFAVALTENMPPYGLHAWSAEGNNRIGTNHKMPGTIEGYAHFLQLVLPQFSKFSGLHDFQCRLPTNPRYTDDHLVVGGIDVDRKVLGISQCPAQLGIHLQIKVAMLGI